MPTIDISDDTFLRLQGYATPLVDSVESALGKVLDLADLASKKSDQSATPRTPHAPMKFAAANLTHTTLTSAVVNGKALPSASCNWNALMMAAVEAAALKLPKGSEISDLLVVNHVKGQKEDSGYKFLKELGISIQGQNSNNAWKAVSHLAKATGIQVEAMFYWSNHPKAARPGEAGRLAV